MIVNNNIDTVLWYRFLNIEYLQTVDGKTRIMKCLGLLRNVLCGKEVRTI